MRELNCERRSATQYYRHYSKDLVILKDRWTGMDMSVGVYASDTFKFTDSKNQAVVLQNHTFAFNVLTSLDNALGWVMSLNRIGLRRRKDHQTLPELFYKMGKIDAPIISIYQIRRESCRMILGPKTDIGCGEYDTHKLIGETEWMMEAEDLQVFGLQEKGPFRVSKFLLFYFVVFQIMFDSQDHIKVRHDIFQHFLDNHFLIPNNVSIEWVIDEYIVKNCNGSTISWKANGHFYELGYTELFSGTAERCIINIRPLKSNIDNVDLIVGTALFYKYCLMLDYGRNELGIALSTFKH